MNFFNSSRSFLTSVLLFLLVQSSSISAQDAAQNEPVFDKLLQTFKQQHFSVGLLLQTVGDLQPKRSFSGNNGFNISNFRVSLSGELDAGFGYFLQTNLAVTRPILDAKMFFKLSPTVTVDAGLFKSPFSKELLTSASAIHFVKRAQVVSKLAPGRQIGVQISGSLNGKTLLYAAGAFNGNGFLENNNDNNHLLYAGRLTFLPHPGNPKEQLEFGFNLAFSKDTNVAISGLLDNFSGRRLLYGGDFQWKQENILFSGEVILSKLIPVAGKTVRPYGYHLTMGRMISRKSQLLIRWDGMETDGLQAESNFLILGFNHWPTRATELQINYILPIEDGIDSQQILINAQIAI